MSSFQHKVALITGGSSGLGLEVARQLSRHGAHICLVARRADTLETALETVRAERSDPGQRFGVISADVSDPEQAQAAVEQTARDMGHPDLVINSAGVARPGYFQETDLDLFHWMMDINYFGIVNICKAVVPGMLDRRAGHIVNVSSASGFLGVFGYTAYTASKFAVSGFSDVLRSELKPHGVKVSIVYPSDIDTPQLVYETRYQPPETRALKPLRSVMPPEAVARVMLRDIERGRYVILPGWDSKSMYLLTRVFGAAVPSIMDLVMRVMYRPTGKKNGT